MAEGRRHRGADCAFGCGGRRHRPGAGRGQPRGGHEAGKGVVRAVSRALLPRAAARRPAADRDAGGADGGAGDQGEAAGRGDAPGAVHEAGRLQGPRGARLHLAGVRARRPAPPEAVHAGPVLQDPGRDGGPLRRHPAGAGEFGGDRAAMQPGDRTGQVEAPGLPYAQRRNDRGLPSPAGRAGSREAPGEALPGHCRARSEGA